MSLNSLIDKLIYKGDKVSPDTYYKGRFFIIIMSFFFLLSIASMPYYFDGVVQITSEIKWLYLSTLTVFAGIFVIYPKYGYRVALINIHSVLASSISMYSTYTIGGGIYSPDLGFSAAITIFIFLVANRISGYIWAIIGILQVSYYYYADINGFHNFRADAMNLPGHYYYYSIIFSVLFAVFMIVQFEISKDKILSILKIAQNETEKHKQELETKNEEILASINYAKRIQQAVLPNEENIYRNIPLSFILYKPKDIVSGDFFWFHEIDRDNYIFVCADCTGHGVPGALMTVIGSNLLTQIIIENKTFKPSQILFELDKKLTATLKQQKEHYKLIQDGMDMSVLRVEKTAKKFIYSGAKRPAAFIKNKEVIEIKSNKYSLGGLSSEEKTFEETEVYYSEEDTIYLFTDGYIDQFGGTENKKFMIKRLRELLQKIHILPMTEQKQILEKTIIDWTGKNDQTDDILVTGIRF